MQGAINAFVPLCQAVTSWVKIQCEGLNNEVIQIMQAYKQNFQTVSLLHSLGTMLDF